MKKKWHHICACHVQHVYDWIKVQVAQEALQVIRIAIVGLHQVFMVCFTSSPDKNNAYH